MQSLDEALHLDPGARRMARHGIVDRDDDGMGQVSHLQVGTEPML